MAVFALVLATPATTPGWAQAPRHGWSLSRRANLDGVYEVTDLVGLSWLLRVSALVDAAELGTRNILLGGGHGQLLACLSPEGEWLDRDAREARCRSAHAFWYRDETENRFSAKLVDHLGRPSPPGRCIQPMHREPSTREIALLTAAVNASKVFPVPIEPITRSEVTDESSPIFGKLETDRIDLYRLDLDGDGRGDQLALVVARPDRGALATWKASRPANAAPWPTPPALIDPELAGALDLGGGVFFIWLRPGRPPQLIGFEASVEHLRPYDRPDCLDADGDGRPELTIALHGDSEREVLLLTLAGDRLKKRGWAGLGD